MKKKIQANNIFNFLVLIIIIALVVIFAVNFDKVVNTNNYLFLISLLTTSITTILVVKNSSKDTSKMALSQTISQFRSEWLVKVKETYANFEYLIESFYNDYKLDEQEYKEIIVLKNRLLVEFNAYRDIHYDLATRLNLISNCLYDIKKNKDPETHTKKIEIIKKASNELFIYFSAYFKIEWQRIKNEVSGKKINFVEEFYKEVESVKKWYKDNNLTPR